LRAADGQKARFCPTKGFCLSRAHEDMFISNAQQAVENTGEFSYCSLRG